LNPSDLQAEDLLDEIHRERDRSREARQRAEEAQRVAQAARVELAARLEKIEDERHEVLENARRQSQNELSELQTEIGKLRAEMARARQPLKDVQAIKQAAEELEELVEQPVVRQTVPESEPDRALRLGDMVNVRSLGHQGIVTALGEGEAEVQIGALRARAKLGDLELISSAAERPVEKPDWSGVVMLAESPGGEISLRGQRFEDAFANLDKYLDAAYAAGLRSARIIHGKGTGTLREMVRKELNKRDYIERYQTADGHEGGEGVTVAFFKN
jgi:DNA mismatch repair protein MutS2